MKKYYKIINEKVVFYKDPLIILDTQIYNPSEGLLLEAGYLEWVEPEVTPSIPTLLESIDDKVLDILDYDSSESVNSFSINGQSGWIDRNTRVALLHALDVVEQNGGTTYTVWFNEMPLLLPITVIKSFLSSLELYAIEALNVTNQHIMQVKQLLTVEEVESFDITQGYPLKIELNL